MLTWYVWWTFIGVVLYLLSLWGAARLRLNWAQMAAMPSFVIVVYTAMPLGAYLLNRYPTDYLGWRMIGSVAVFAVVLSAVGFVPYRIYWRRQRRADQARKQRVAEEAEAWINRFGA